MLVVWENMYNCRRATIVEKIKYFCSCRKLDILKILTAIVGITAIIGIYLLSI